MEGPPVYAEDRFALVFGAEPGAYYRRSRLSTMLENKLGNPKSERRLLPGPSSPHAVRQQRLTAMALALLLLSLVLVLYRDRDFWFPEAQEADTRLLSVPDARPRPSAPAELPADDPIPAKQPRPRGVAQKHPEVRTDPPTPPPLTVIRTVLPPLEVEVVAGDAHRTLRPGSNAIHVDLQHTPAAQNPSLVADTAASITTRASQRGSLASNAAASMVTESVQPDYPLLARQMKVQGSVVLQALIGRDGMIQDLRVLSGPPILATAAEEAVRQWHFKPHFMGAQPVETRANITVNFTISTN